MLRWAYLERVVAGAIFGVYMAHLLYFLNPQVDITPGKLLLVTLIYGVICGLLFGSALWGLRILRVRLLGRPDPSRRTHGFGFVVLAVFIAAAIYWMHLEVFRIYLPVGAVRILSKSTTLIAAVAFVLLMLWVVERNADRRTARILFLAGVGLIIASSFFLYQRRESYRVEKRNVVVANVGTVAGERMVTFIAIRNLPYDWIVTIAGEGGVPFFEQATRSAYFTRLEPFQSSHPKALWASLATGKLPSRHGVTGRFSYRTPLNAGDPDERFLILPRGVGFQGWGLIPPVKRISAQLPAGDALPLWTLFERLGLHALAIGWRDASPSGASRVITDEALQQMAGRAPASGRFHATGSARPRVESALAADRAAIALAAEGSYDLRVVALDGFEQAQRALHIFSNELPPGTSMKGAALRTYVQELDKLLASIARAHPDHLLVICSPTAVVPPTLPANISTLVARAIRNDDPGADDGFLLLTGAGTVDRENPAGAHVQDVVPTLLFAAGLPVGRDMDGKIITDAFSDDFLRRTTLSAIQTYEAEQLIVRRGAT
jgi:hypothetical protein